MARPCVCVCVYVRHGTRLLHVAVVEYDTAMQAASSVQTVFAPSSHVPLCIPLFPFHSCLSVYSAWRVRRLAHGVLPAAW